MTSLTLPLAPVLPEPPDPMVLAGVIPRLMALVARIKTAPNYTESIGQTLGLVGAEQVVDPSEWKPVISAALAADSPLVQWPKGRSDALELWVDRGDGNGFIFCAICTDPHYQDSAAQPASAALWHYKGIYRVHDQRVGRWSDVLSVAVGA